MRRYFIAAAALLALVSFGLAQRAEDRGQRASQHMKSYLGVTVAASPQEPEQEGVVITGVTPNSPAAKAGLKKGDVITQVGNRVVEDYDDLANAITRHQPGERVFVQVLRNGQEENFHVTLKPRPNEATPKIGEGESRPGRYGREDEGDRNRGEQTDRTERPAFLGVEAREWTSDNEGERGAGEGVEVLRVDPNTPAAHAGLKKGDIITKINGKEVATPQELRQAVRKAGAGKEITLGVLRGNQHKDLRARLERMPAAIEEEQEHEPALEITPFAEQRPEIERLKRRIDQLERRVRELEQQHKEGKEGARR
jgi:S1-C subfamily serine protease